MNRQKKKKTTSALYIFSLPARLWTSVAGQIASLTHSQHTRSECIVVNSYRRLRAGSYSRGGVLDEMYVANVVYYNVITTLPGTSLPAAAERSPLQTIQYVTSYVLIYHENVGNNILQRSVSFFVFTGVQIHTSGDIISAILVFSKTSSHDRLSI